MSDDVNWEQTMMLLIHRAMRSDLSAFARTLRQHADAPPTPDARAALRDRWDFFDRSLHHHHEGEDTVLWPTLRRSIPDARPLLDELEAEHAALDQVLTDVRAGFNGLAAAGPNQMRGLADHVDTLAAALNAHLEHEERDAVPLLERHVGPEAAKAFEKQQQKATGMADGAVFFPWITADATEAEAEHAWGRIPALLRWALRGRWTKAYERKTAAAFPFG